MSISNCISVHYKYVMMVMMMMIATERRRVRHTAVGRSLVSPMRQQQLPDTHNVYPAMPAAAASIRNVSGQTGSGCGPGAGTAYEL